MGKIVANDFGLHSRVNLVRHDDHIGIIIDRKSRIIMKDGHRIVNQAKKINTIQASNICLYTSAPVCGKTKEFLKKNDIAINYI